MARTNERTHLLAAPNGLSPHVCAGVSAAPVSTNRSSDDVPHISRRLSSALDLSDITEAVGLGWSEWGGDNPLECVQRFFGSNEVTLKKVFEAARRGRLTEFEVSVANLLDQYNGERGVDETCSGEELHEEKQVNPLPGGQAVAVCLTLLCRNAEYLTLTQIAAFSDRSAILDRVLDLARTYCPPPLLSVVVNASHEKGKRGASALMLSATVKTSERLLQAGAETESQDSSGRTALHHAAGAGNAAVVSVLLRYGAQINAKDGRGATALHWAVFEGYYYTAMLLIAKGADQTIQDAQGQTPLMLACTLGDDFLAKQLILEGAPLFPKDSLGRNALQLARLAGTPSTVRAVKSGKSDRLVAWLAQKGFMVAFFWVAFLLAQCASFICTFPYIHIPHVASSLALQKVFLGLAVLVAFCYAQVWLRDPGYVEKTEDVEFERILSNETGVVPCPTCQTSKAKRSKHCHACKRCVYRFDHHCPWINNCVGLKNHSWFYTFCSVFVINVLGIFLAGVSCLISAHFSFLSSTEPQYLSRGWMDGAISMCTANCLFGCRIFLVFISALFGGPTLVLCCVQFLNVSRNITTNETFNKEKYPYLRNERGAFQNPYDRGLARNWWELYCGDRKDLIQLYSKPDRGTISV